MERDIKYTVSGDGTGKTYGIYKVVGRTAKLIEKGFRTLKDARKRLKEIENDND